MRSYEKVFKKPLKIYQLSHEEMTLQLYESNIEPYLRCMHIRNLDAVGWISIDAGKYSLLNYTISSSEINISCEWTNLNRIEDMTIQPFTVASFDIECTSTDGTFPQAYRDGDQIIQIGTTFMRFGESECYYQHIVTLNSCDPLPDADVESYEKEQEVLLAWVRMMQRMNPDIVTGYNIVGFDLEYLKDRAKKLGIEEQFSKLTRITGQRAEWKEPTLASSALGTNILKYYEMTGRVLVDMMKVIQRDFKLESYKLDFSAAYFIKEEIQKLVLKSLNKNNSNNSNEEVFDKFFDNAKIKNNSNSTSTIETKNTYGTKEGQYISVYYTDGIAYNKHMDGKKFVIVEMTKTSIIVDGIIDESIMKEGYKVYWCHAKDDVSPKDIFRLQKGTSKDRSIVAKYCLMDTILVNKLMSKLSVLTNNIGMANVCNVPLSYLFLRGQGIKIYSLVSKECRTMQHLIPTLIKEFKSDEEAETADKEDKKLDNLIAQLNGDDDFDEEDEGYEGAIVFPPTPGVYHEPITVLDYASLYPRSMVCRNLSHECCVLDDGKYGDLPGYKYNVISYMTGTFEHIYDRKLLNKLMKAYKNNNAYLIEEKQVDPSKLRYHFTIYDKDHKGNKRWKCSEILVNKDKIIVTNFETSKFAEKLDGTKGIIPKILLDLLNARSKYKDEMEAEKDSFKKAILDGLQLAYKITANSLYGQTGASVSSICMKRIAASTTAVGREMLVFSKDFAENIFGKMINLALSNKQAYLEYCNETFKTAPNVKFNAPKKGWNNRQEYYEAFYKKMNDLLPNKTVDPHVVYGDSITPDTPVMIKNNEGKIEIKQIKDFGMNWIKYDAFKADVANEYFEEIIKTLLKSKEDVEESKQQYAKENLINASGWFGGKYSGTFYKESKRNLIIVNIERKDKGIKKLFKSFNTKQLGESQALKLAEEYLNKQNEEFELARNRLRIKLDIETNETYLEVDLTKEVTMLCDMDDIDVINDNIWFAHYDYTNHYAKCANNDKYHASVLKKLLSILPKVVRSQIESFSVDHINQNTLDNRKKNLRLVEFREQTWNRGLFNTNSSGTNGVYYKEDSDRYVAYWVGYDNKRKFRHFEDKQDTIDRRNLEEQLVLEKFEENRDNLQINLMKDIVNDQKERYCKEQSLIDGCVFANKGWSKINRLIRHKTNKKLYRVITNTGACDVTEDHSLLDKNGNLIKPKDCVIGTELLHSFPTNFNELVCNINEQQYNLPCYITQDKLEATKYHYISKKNGYNVKIEYIEPSKLTIQKVKVDGTYLLMRTTNAIENSNKITNIIKLDDVSEGVYVYDIETEEGRFNAGIGEVTLSNTDSIFISNGITDNTTKEVGKDKTALEQSIQLGIWASHTICLLLPEPQEQCYEKVLWPFIILTKKRYVGNLYEKNPNKFYQKSMGIVLKRRDNAQIVKIVCGGIIDQILNKKDNEGAVRLTQKLLKQILSEKFPMDKFVITKTLGQTYKFRERIVQAVLADRMAERDPGNKPMPNDRIPYAYVIVDKEVECDGERVEHPDYIVSEGLKLDYLHYITNQIQKPAVQFLELIVENANGIFQSYIIKEQNRRKGKRAIKTYLVENDNDNKKNQNENISVFDGMEGETLFDKNKKSRSVANITKFKKEKKKKNNEDSDSETSMTLE